MLPLQAELSFPIGEENWFKTRHLDCETKHGDVRKRRECRHLTTLALPPCVCMHSNGTLWVSLSHNLCLTQHRGKHKASDSSF